MTEAQTADRSSAVGKAGPMEVFLVPAGETRYELYCEPAEAEHTHGAGAVGRVFRRVREILAPDQEAQPRRPSEPDEATGSERWTVRMRAGALRGMTEWVADQRLLWQLRHEDAAILVFPDDIEAARALSIARTALRRDSDHHRLWMLVDGLATAVSGPLFFFVPGPNLISWYFAAKTVGHWLAFQGARRGLDGTTWSSRGSGSLTAVRGALHLPSAERYRQLRELAGELGLEHLASFLERTAT